MGKQVQRSAVALFAGFVVGAATGGVLLGAARKALRGVALASTVIAGGTVAGVLTAGGVYVVCGHRSNKHFSEPVRSVSSTDSTSQDCLSHSSTISSENASVSSDSSSEEAKFSLPGELLPRAAIPEQLKGAKFAPLGPVLPAFTDSLVVYPTALTFAVGNKGIYPVLHHGVGGGPVEIFDFLDRSREVTLPIRNVGGGADGGLITVEGSRYRELACCGRQSIAICNFETETTERFDLPQELREQPLRSIYRSHSGDFWMLAKGGKDGQIWFSRLAADRSDGHRLPLGVEISSESRDLFVSFGRKLLFGVEREPEAFCVATRMWSRSVLFQAIGAEGTRGPLDRLEARRIIDGLYVILEGDHVLQVKSLSGESFSFSLEEDAGFVEATLEEGPEGPIAVAWTEGGRLALIDTTKPPEEALSYVETGLELKDVDRFSELFEGRVLVFGRGSTRHLVDRDSGEVLTTVQTTAREIFDTPWGVVAADLQVGEGVHLDQLLPERDN